MAKPTYSDNGDLFDGGFDMSTGGACGYVICIILLCHPYADVATQMPNMLTWRIQMVLMMCCTCNISLVFYIIIKSIYMCVFFHVSICSICKLTWHERLPCQQGNIRLIILL